MKYVSRSGWNARAFRQPNGAIEYSGTRAGVKVHYLGKAYQPGLHEQCAPYIRSLQNYHMDTNGWSDIGYSFLVCSHGYVFEGRGLKRRNSGNGNTQLNERHYAVCALFGTSGNPSDAMLHGLVDAIEHCRKNGPCGNEVLGHKDGYPTQCPGDTLYAWVRNGAKRPTRPAPAPKAGQKYTIQPGDTLVRIASKVPGVTWQQIHNANRDVIGADANKIRAGVEILIPKAGQSTPPTPKKPQVSLSRLIQAARNDPPKAGTPVSYDQVIVVERALNKEGILAAQYVDGHFGTVTISAYSQWQLKLGYRGTNPGGAADGIPGRASLEALARKYGFDVIA